MAQASRRERGGVQRVEIPVGPVRPLAWLHAQDESAVQVKGTALYWHGRGDTDAVAALGVADELDGSVASVLAALDMRTEALRTAALRAGAASDSRPRVLRVFSCKASKTRSF